MAVYLSTLQMPCQNKKMNVSDCKQSLFFKNLWYEHNEIHCRIRIWWRVIMDEINDILYDRLVQILPSGVDFVAAVAHYLVEVTFTAGSHSVFPDVFDCVNVSTLWCQGKKLQPTSW